MSRDCADAASGSTAPQHEVGSQRELRARVLGALHAGGRQRLRAGRHRGGRARVDGLPEALPRDDDQADVSFEPPSTTRARKTIFGGPIPGQNVRTTSRRWWTSRSTTRPVAEFIGEAPEASCYDDAAPADAIDAMGALLRESDYEMKPLLKALFKSRGVLLPEAEGRVSSKNPVETCIGFIRSTGLCPRPAPATRPSPENRRAPRRDLDPRAPDAAADGERLAHRQRVAVVPGHARPRRTASSTASRTHVPDSAGLRARGDPTPVDRRGGVVDTLARAAPTLPDRRRAADTSPTSNTGSGTRSPLRPRSTRHTQHLRIGARARSTSLSQHPSYAVR